jgi:preprotein translocase subunit SecB
MSAEFSLDRNSYDPVRPMRVYLSHAHFYDPEDTPEYFPEEAAFRVNLDLQRPEPLVLKVALSVTTEGDEAPLQLTCTYVAEYEMSASVPDAERERLWQDVVHGSAPRLLYPYVREFYSNITSRWRGGAFTLPHTPFPFPFTGLAELPPPPGDAPYQSELPLEDEPGDGT